MKTFPLRIGTPDGLMFEGDNVVRIVCRGITGDLAILAGHCNFCTAIGMGEAHVVLEDGTVREAACIGGMLSMMDGVCSLWATTWEVLREIWQFLPDTVISVLHLVWERLMWYWKMVQYVKLPASVECFL